MKAANLTLRFLLELAALGALGFWGAQAGRTPAVRVLLTVGAPLGAALLWGAVVAPKARLAVSPPVRRAVEALVFGAAVLALLSVGRWRWALAFALLLLLNQLLLLRWGQRAGGPPRAL